VDCEPLIDLAPDQAPEAMQAVALLDAQVKAALLPLVIVLGLAARAMVGAGGVTETVVACEALPPAPVQVSEYVALAVKAPVDCDPLVALEPDQAPEAVQEVALVDDQLRVDAAPLAMVLGLALRFTAAVGVGVTVIVAD
jgi:hypothetical protein